jgi:hypothetical protein
MDKIRKREGDYHGQRRTTWFLWKEGVNCQIFIVDYLQFLERKHLHTTLCSIRYGASTVARKLYRWLSISGIANPLKNGSVKPSGSSQGDGSDVQT